MGCIGFVFVFSTSMYICIYGGYVGFVRFRGRLGVYARGLADCLEQVHWRQENILPTGCGDDCCRPVTLSILSPLNFHHVLAFVCQLLQGFADMRLESH